MPGIWGAKHNVGRPDNGTLMSSVLNRWLQPMCLQVISTSGYGEPSYSRTLGMKSRAGSSWQMP